MQEQKEEEATVTRAVKPTPAFEEHVILPSGLHEDAQLNLISVPLAEVDKAYGQNEVIFFFVTISVDLSCLFIRAYIW